ncbi:hypothetical protein GCM10023189_58550 [Nibrella saemangeumensis]|uniref:Phage shock protein C (PspC) family protein n=1 Tax=Nibrella saemangeumensis TaxID=1084526 RepID=A0ABP8NNL3_9BACT
MKKTISINISGVIFHIEEDGYDKLKSYLSSIQQYFSGYEDSQEIVTDIENRIAEKLLAKLKAAEKQAISIEDVNELISAMGTVADFEAVEEEEVLVGGSRQYAADNGYTTTGGPQPGASGRQSAAGIGASSTTTAPPRKLYRDLNRKTIAGVASGIAHYFNIDPVWVRLLFLTLVLGLPPFSEAVFNNGGGFFSGLAGFTLLFYIAMWIAFPGSMQLEEDKSIKKFYRNPDDKVLGGVASGLAAYFGIDPGVVRLLFVLGIVFFGVGFLAYIILWIISPEAQTLTEKMEMKGQPITLTNIEHNIKRSLNINDSAEESTITKVLLFPFRFIAVIVNGLGRALGPFLGGLVAVIRVFVGVIMLVVAFALMVAALAVAGVGLGISSGATFGDSDFPLHLLRQDIGAPLIMAGFVAVFLPFLALAILGVMLITRRTMVSSRTALTLLGVWLVSIIILSATVPNVVANFRRTSSVEETKTLTVAGTPTFDLNRIDADYMDSPGIRLEGYEGADYRLVQTFKAKGRTRAEAEANARTITYNVTSRDSVIRFDDGLELAANARFRVQELDMNLYIPYDKPFRMTESFARYIRNEFGNREMERMNQTVWQFTRAEGLVSLNFPRELNRDRNGDSDDDLDNLTDEVENILDEELGDDFSTQGEYTRQFDVSSFKSVNASGAFSIRIVKGDTFKVVADGRERDINDLRVKVDGDQLEVSLDRSGLFNWKDTKRIGLTVTMPAISELKLSGASRSMLAGFGQMDDLTIDLSGACRSVVDGDVQKLAVDLSGASKAILKGRADVLDAQIGGASKMDATGMDVRRATVEAGGASSADMGQVESLESKTSGASKIRRRGGDVE